MKKILIRLPRVSAIVLMLYVFVPFLVAYSGGILQFEKYIQICNSFQNPAILFVIFLLFFISNIIEQKLSEKY